MGYAYQGRYDSGWFAYAGGTTYTKSHNLGMSISAMNADFWVNTAADGSGAGGKAFLFTYSGNTYGSGFDELTRLSISARAAITVVFTDKNGSAQQATYARFTVYRGW